MKNKDWIYIGFQPVGGLREIGFIGSSNFLMILGGRGRTIFDCLTSTKYARNKSDYYSEKWNSNTGLIEGFEEFENITVECGGYEYKDIVAKKSSDNWDMIIKPEKKFDYKNELADAEVLYLRNRIQKKEYPIHTYHNGIDRSYGFSPSGETLVIAQSHGIYFWKKIDENLSEKISLAIIWLNRREGMNVTISDKIATIGLSLEPYQTSNTEFNINNLNIEEKTEGSMIQLLGEHKTFEFRKYNIKQINISEDNLQIDILLRNVVWRRIEINPVDNKRSGRS